MEKSRESIEGYKKIGDDGFRTQGGLYVPILRQDELTKVLQACREEIGRAAVAAKQAEDIEAFKATQAVTQSVTEPVEILAFCEPEEFDTEEPELLVPCIFEADVRAQQLMAAGNPNFAEKDRYVAMRALTKGLLSRPMTRRIDMPRDIEAAMSALADLAPHVPELVKFYRIPLLVARATGAPPMVRPLLLVGGPGIGKTYIATQLAALLNVTSHLVNYAPAGYAGNSLSGADKSWGNSTTGAVFDCLAHGEIANPLIILEEIDKASRSTTMSGMSRNPINELLGLLEPVSAKIHKDRCAEIQVDARHIMWVATANSLAGISAPILSRFQVIHVKRPDARAAVMIAASVAEDVTAQMGADLKAPSGEVLQFLATYSPRLIRQLWIDAAGQAFINGRKHVTMSDIEQSIGLAQKPVQRLH